MPRKKPSISSAPPQPELPACTPPENRGLTTDEVQVRLDAGLVNTAVESPTKSEKQIIYDNCFTFFNLIFVVLAVCLMLVRSFGDMLFLIIAIANTLIGIFQEIRSKRTLDALTLMAARPVTVIRDGKAQQIPSESLVRDDIVEFSAGDQICADATVRSGSVQVNESLLTGEQDALTREAGGTLLSGSFVVAGHCRAQLTSVGSASYASRLTVEARQDSGHGGSEMMKSLDKVIRVIGIMMIPLGIALFLKEYRFLGLDLQSSVQATVAALIGMIPEGLYLLTSVALAVSVIRLASKRVLTRDMSCIENLARVDILCVDKTGTITEPVMEASEPIPLAPATYSLREIFDALSAVYSASRPDNDTGRAMAARFCDAPDWTLQQLIPFTSATKWMAATFEEKGSFLVGAPDFIMGSRFAEIREAATDWEQRGYRVLLLAACDGIPEPGALDPEQLTPMALIPLTNRVRPEAATTFQYFAEQGVTIKVISGDNPLTVSEVARQAGIMDADLYVDASTLETDEALEEAAGHYAIFGRVTPDQKRRLVRSMQKAGHTVAMTGDGVNDVLALKEADCGIAMASGAEAASQVAQLVLLDSDFSTMPAVVDEGRRVINNIQRAASLFFVKNIFSFMLTIISLFIDLPYPLIPLHLSVISGLTIGVPAFFLALEPNHELVRGRFISNVFLKALPGGLTNVFLIVLIEAFVSVFNFPDEQLYTMSAVVMSVVGLRVLYQVARPLDWKRGLIITTMTLALIFCYTVLADLLGYTEPTVATALVLAVFIMLSFQVMRTILQIFEKFEALVMHFRLRQQQAAGLQDRRQHPRLPAHHTKTL